MPGKRFFGEHTNEEDEENFPPRKHSRSFTIRNVLELPDSPPPPTKDDNNAAKYIQQLEGETKLNKKFATMQMGQQIHNQGCA